MSSYLLPYSQGTISLENGSTAVVGAVTAWTSEVMPGDWLIVGGERYTVASVAGNTSLTLLEDYAGATDSGLAYAIHRVSRGWGDASKNNLRLAEIFSAMRRGLSRSLSEIEIGVGEHQFTVTSEMQVLPGQRLLFSSRAPGESLTHWILGGVTAYEGTTLTIEALDFEGEGDTRSDWNINISGSPGPQGSSAYQVAVADGFVGDQAAWLASLQGVPGPKWVDWQGTWSAGEYTAGQGVEHDGSTYRANTTTTEEPPHADWDLVASKGADGLGTGDVTGPAGGVADGEVPVFDGDTGKALKGSGVTLSHVVSRQFGIVRVAATENIDIATELAAGEVVDGVTLDAGDIVMLAAQDDAEENGVYLVPASGAASRYFIYTAFNDLCGAYFSVMEGDENADTLWRCTSNKGGTIDVDPIVIEEASFGAGSFTDLADAPSSYTGHARKAVCVKPDESGLEYAIYWREKLTAARTYYVRTDGNDSNDGLTNSSGGAFLTISRAISVVFGLDLNGHNVTISLGTGVGGGISVSGQWVGRGTVSIVGNPSSPGDNVTSGMTCSLGARVSVSGLRFVSSYRGIEAYAGAAVTIAGKCEFGACTSAHISAEGSGTVVTIASPYDIIGSADNHYVALGYGQIIKSAGSSYTINVIGTPAFTTFAYAISGYIGLWATTFSGAATGKRYSAELNGILNTFGGGASYFPGNSAGSTSTGGQYQ